MDFLNSLIDRVDWETVALTGLRLVLIVLITLLVSALLNRLLRQFEGRVFRQEVEAGGKMGESRKRAQTLVGLARQALVLVIWVIAGLMALKELGIEIGPILAGAGILGVALGFGAQSLVKDFIAGFFLVLENQVRVGDVAKVNGVTGLVEQINFRTLVLRTLSGEVHIFANGEITTMSNLTNEWSAYIFDIGVAYKENTDRVVEVIRVVGEELRADSEFGPLVTKELEVFGVDKLDDSAVVIKGRITTRPMRQWDVGREFLRRIKLAFDEVGIEIPFPHRTLYFGEASPPIELSGVVKRDVDSA